MDAFDQAEYRMISRILILLSLSIVCSSAMSFPVRTERWSEDVVLLDGRPIKVAREVEWTSRISSGDAASGFQVFQNWPDKFWLSFEHPDSHKTIKWQGEQHFRPILLNLVNGVPYLILHGQSTKDTESVYGCPELPYIYVRYDSSGFGKWRVITQDEAPAILRSANLSPGYPDFGKLSEDEENTFVKSNGHRYRDMSTGDVQQIVAKMERSSERHFQREIPRTYEEWRYSYKNSYLNERKRGDCRPPRAQLPSLILPAAVEGSPEVLDTVDYATERVYTGDEWTRLRFDAKRYAACKKLFRPADPVDYRKDQRFVNDSTGNKRVPYSSNGQFQMGASVVCDEQVWFVTHMEERGKMIITRFTISGDLVSRVSFRQPEPIQGFVGYISIPSLRSEAGYLYFDWMDFRNVVSEWRVKRIVKMRVREPAPQN